MPLYKCEFCKFQTEKKTDFQRHKDRKVPCTLSQLAKRESELESKIEKIVEERIKQQMTSFSPSQIIGDSKYSVAKSTIVSMIGRLHDELRNKDSIIGKAAFDDIIKILFIRFIQPHLKGRLSTLMDPTKYTSLKWFEPKYLQALDFTFLMGTTDSDFKDIFYNCWDMLCEHEFTNQIFEKGKTINCKLPTIRFCMNEIYTVMRDTEFDVLDADIKGDIYEEFINKYAAEGKVFGQYFTPRNLIHTIFSMIESECNGPNAYENVYDPAAGTCGFIMEAVRKYKIAACNIYGQEKVPSTYATGLMNILLTTGETGNIVCADSFRKIGNKQFKLIVTNPPFGINEEYDTLISDCNKNKMENDMNPLTVYPHKTNDGCALFLQHCMAKLDIGGTCAIVVPNGKLLTMQGKYLAIRKQLLQSFDVRAILIASGGTFENAGVSTVVIIFQRNGQSTQNIKYFEYDGIVSCKPLATVSIAEIQAKKYSLGYNAYKKQIETNWNVSYTIKKLSEICKIDNGERITKESAQHQEQKYPVLGGGGETFRSDNFNRSGKTCKIGRFGVSEHNCVMLLDNEYWLNDSGFTVSSTSPEIYNEYLYYYLFIHSKNVYNLCEGSVQKNMNMSLFTDLDIAYPTLEEQVRIIQACDVLKYLKQCTEHQLRTLEAARNVTKMAMQRLVNFAPIKTIGELCQFLPKRGDYKAGDGLTSGLYRFYSCAKTTKYIDVCEYNEPCLIINKGGNANIRMDNNFTVSNDIHVIRFVNPDNTTNLVLTYYAYHYLKVNIEEIICKMSGATIKHLTKEDLKNISIRIPDQEIQLKYIQAFADYDMQIQSNEKLIDINDNKIKETFIGLTSSP